MEISICSKENIKELANIARKENIITEEKKSKTIYFCAKENNKLIGIARIILLSKKTARLSGLFVLQEYRNVGIGSQLIDERINYCIYHGYEKITTFAYRPNRYKMLGFKLIKQYESKSGETYFMEKIL